jgi:hypothetical protein
MIHRSGGEVDLSTSVSERFLLRALQWCRETVTIGHIHSP